VARVLIVDDERSIRLTLPEFLRAEGHEVYAAEDVPAALSVLGKMELDIVVTDIILPRATGVDLLKQLHESSPHVKVIMMTGEPTLETASESLRAGAFDYLVKPVTKNTVCLVVSKAAHLKSVEDENRRLVGELEAHRDNLELEITERTQELAQSEGRHRLVVENMRDVVALLDMELNPVWISQSALRTGGYSPEGHLVLKEHLTPPSQHHAMEAFARELTPDRVADSGEEIVFSLELEYLKKAGGTGWIESTFSVLRDEAGTATRILSSSHEITERKQAEQRQRAEVEILRTLDQHESILDTVGAVVRAVKEHIVVDAVGIRLVDGDDYPYRGASGFSREYMQALSPFCARDESGEVVREADGYPRLNCLCEMVIRGHTDPAQPFFTEFGSFWTNSTTAFRASAWPAERRVQLRDTCNSAGYESVMLVPLRAGKKLLGLLQLNDRRPDRFAIEDVNTVENLATAIALALDRRELIAEEHRSRIVTESVAEASLRYLETSSKVQMAEVLVDRIMKSIGARYACISERKETGELEVLAQLAAGAKTRLDESSDGLDLELPADLITESMERAESIISNFLPSHEAELESILVVPLINDSVAIGVLAITTEPDGFGARETAIANAFANAAAVALRAARTESARESIEDQLRQSQRMEAVGRLAGGIAHDYNNLLTVILGLSGFMVRELPEGDPLLADAKVIHDTGKRAETLTRQLLAFSRRQILQPKIIDLNLSVADMERILRRVIGEDIELTTVPADALRKVLADPGQIEQVLMNLAVNARDAMPDGGQLTIETANVDLGFPDDTCGPDLEPGLYVMLSVTDTGSGMDEQTLQSAFEPFFTTKELGKGTGLGLSTVYGIVKQSRGDIRVESELERGTTFRVYLPLADDEAAQVSRRPNTSRDWRSRADETILVVEDESAVRLLVTRILASVGYTVIEARDGNEAILVAAHHAGDIDLLLTDVIMPGPSGRHTATVLQEQRPDLKVVFMSGYTDDVIARHGVLDKGTQFIEKPFSPEQLLRTLRDVLEMPSEKK
jgi:PAS domain S-box-containing protein